MKSLPLGKHCSACGKERKSKALRYDPVTLLAFCDNPYICSQDHPNSPYNILKNQQESLLVSYNEANESHKRQLLESFDSEIVSKIQAMLQKPLTLRIHDPAMAQFVVEFQEVAGLPTTSDVFRYAIEALMNSHDIELLRADMLKEEVEEDEPEVEPEPEEEEEVPTTEKVPDAWTF